MVEPPPADLPADKADPWASIIDTALDEETGELTLVVDDEKAPEAASSTDTAPAPEAGQAPAEAAAPEPPLDKSAQELRAWATRVAQENARNREEIDRLKARNEQADAAVNDDEFIRNLAERLPEEVFSDRRSFATVVTKVAARMADKATKSLSEQVTTLKGELSSMGRALEFSAAASPEVQALVPHVRNIATQYQEAYGRNVFDDYSVSDVLTVARGYRDHQSPSQQPQATTAPGQASTPPPAAPPAREARPPVTPAQRAAASSGVSVGQDAISGLGRPLAKGPGSFNENVRSLIDDVIGEAISGAG
jgi:hypothetical protein